MSRPFTVKFWGVRGSYPVSGKDHASFGGSTTCLEISIGHTIIIIDAGTGIIPLGNRIAADFFSRKDELLELTLLFTHLHHDHSQGLPFFTPLFLGQSLIHLFGPRNFGQELARVLEYSMTPPNFPIDLHQTNSVKELHTVRESSRILMDSEHSKPALYNRFQDSIPVRDTSILISIHHDYSHPTDGVLIYKIEYQGKSVVFSTDVEGYLYGNNKLINYAKNADLLIHDAQYSTEEYTALPTPKQGFGHSTPEMAIEVAQKAKVKNLALTHHDPRSVDSALKKNELGYQKKLKNLFYAREGATFTV
jgi:ribonuclease BN (tRNA processing enzyme)